MLTNSYFPVVCDVLPGFQPARESMDALLATATLDPSAATTKKGKDALTAG